MTISLPLICCTSYSALSVFLHLTVWLLTTPLLSVSLSHSSPTKFSVYVYTSDRAKCNFIGPSSWSPPPFLPSTRETKVALTFVPQLIRHPNFSKTSIHCSPKLIIYIINFSYFYSDIWFIKLINKLTNHLV